MAEKKGLPVTVKFVRTGTLGSLAHIVALAVVHANLSAARLAHVQVDVAEFALESGRALAVEARPVSVPVLGNAATAAHARIRGARRIVQLTRLARIARRTRAVKGRVGLLVAARIQDRARGTGATVQARHRLALVDVAFGAVFGDAKLGGTLAAVVVDQIVTLARILARIRLALVYVGLAVGALVAAIAHTLGISIRRHLTEAVHARIVVAVGDALLAPVAREAQRAVAPVVVDQVNACAVVEARHTVGLAFVDLGVAAFARVARLAYANAP